jgi:hypothetical protein
MESFSRRVQSLAAGLVILGLMGCGDEDRIQVSILETRDAARDFERAVISLSTIELLREDVPASVYLGERRLLELVATSNVGINRPRPSPVQSLLVSGEIPAGPYRAIRLAISGGFIEVLQLNGSTKSYATEGYDVIASSTQVAGALTLSEEALSGFDVVLPGEDSLGTQPFDIFLNFDVVRSFSQNPSAADRWVMHPHVTAETRLSPPPPSP